jgi:signal peptidase II
VIGGPPPRESVMRPSYRPWLWTLALTGFALDQTSKYVVFASLAGARGYSREVILQVFELVALRVRNDIGEAVLFVNRGAALGWLDQWGARANAGCALTNVVAVAVIGLLRAHRATVGDRKLRTALGLVLAGILGNLCDRLLFGGVRDFLHWYLAEGGLVFNFADCCLALGGGQLLFQILRSQPWPAGVPSDDGKVTHDWYREHCR